MPTTLTEVMQTSMSENSIKILVIKSLCKADKGSRADERLREAQGTDAHQEPCQCKIASCPGSCLELRAWPPAGKGVCLLPVDTWKTPVPRHHSPVPLGVRLHHAQQVSTLFDVSFATSHEQLQLTLI